MSATAGTISHNTRTPLTVWFAAAWLMTSSKVGISAIHLQREMGLGSYQSAWAMPHRYRSVMVRRGRDRLRGDVEVDESFLGGSEPGMPGRGALGKVLFAGAVERDGYGFGRARLAVIADASAASLRTFLVSTSGQQAHEVLPAVHTVFSLVKRWVIGTLQNSVSPQHLQAYFDEWVFRFNRRARAAADCSFTAS